MPSLALRLLSLALLAAGLALPAAPARALEFDPVRFIDVDELQPGQIAQASTVFEGTEPEPFEVMILGVLRNASPGGDLVLVRLLGKRLEHTGVVAGMSGSPVLVNGRLLGAIAYAFPFAKDPIGMVTPIRSMIEAARYHTDPGPSGRNRTASPSFAELQALVRGDAIPPSPDRSSIAPVATPLLISGASPEFLRRLAPILQPYGWIPVQAGGATAAATGGLDSLRGGSAIAVPLIRGDFEYAAVGTVTWREGAELLAFGHPLLQAGSMAFPLAAATIHATVPSHLNSFKMGSAGPVIGTLLEDRAAACYARLDRRPPVIPMSLELRGLHSRPRTFRFELAQHDSFSTLLAFIALSQVLIQESRAVGPTTLDLRLSAQFEDHVSFERADLLVSASDPMDTALQAMAPLLELANNPFAPLRLRQLDLQIDASEQRRQASVRSLGVPRRIVERGERFELDVELDVYGAAAVRLKLPVVVPANAPAGPLRLSVLDRAAFEAWDRSRAPGQAPDSLPELLRHHQDRPLQNELRLVIADSRPGVTLQGRELGALPPTIRSLYQRDLTIGHTQPTTGSILYQTSVRTAYALSGTESIELQVRP